MFMNSHRWGEHAWTLRHTSLSSDKNKPRRTTQPEGQEWSVIQWHKWRNIIRESEAEVSRSSSSCKWKGCAGFGRWETSTKNVRKICRAPRVDKELPRLHQERLILITFRWNETRSRESPITMKILLAHTRGETKTCKWDLPMTFGWRRLEGNFPSRGNRQMAVKFQR